MSVHPKLIVERERLAEVLSRIESSVALDCEFHTPGLYFPRLCLVQIGIGGEAWAIDPRLDLSPLAPVLESERITKILHDGRQDLAILMRATKATKVSRLFDTQLAAAFVGYGGSIGYAALVREIVQVELDKSLQTSDWTGPLSHAQVEYALSDVRHLEAVNAHLTRELETRGRRTWADASFDELVERAVNRPEPSRLYLRVSGQNRVPAHALGVFREAAIWRDRVAEAIDRPLNTVASDAALKTIAEKQPRDVAQAMAIRGIGAGRTERWAKALVDAVSRGLEHPEERRALRPKDEQRIDGIVAALGVVRRIVAARESIASELLADQGELRALAEAFLEAPDELAEIGPLAGWRRDVVGTTLVDVLHGRASLRIDASEPAGVKLVPPRSGFDPLAPPERY